jgi:hypothetical protein
MSSTKFKIALLILSMCILSGGCNNKPDIEPYTLEPVGVYPNPATVSASVYINNKSNVPYVLQVFDTNGKKIAEQTFNTGTFYYPLSLSDKPKGNYQVILKTPAAVFRKKLIKI